MTPAGTSDELDVQNEWEEKTHTRPGSRFGRPYESMRLYVFVLSSHLKKNLNAPRPSEHPSHLFSTSGLWTYQPGSQEEGHTGFLHLPSAVLALTLLAKRTQPFLSLVDREVEFCVRMN